MSADYKVIGFSAVGTKPDGELYDCSFMVSYPLRAMVTQQDVQAMCNQAAADFRNMHPTGKLTGRYERVLRL